MERVGELLAVANGLLFAFSNIFNKRALDEMDAATGMIVTLVVNNLINAAGLLVIFLGGHWVPLVPRAVVWFVLAGIATSFIGRQVLFASVRMNGPSRAGSYKVAAPLFTVLIGLLILKEKVGTGALVGAGICLAGICVISLRGFSHPRGEIPESPWKSLGPLVGLASALAYAGGMAVRKVGIAVWPSAVGGAEIGSLTAMTLTLVSFAVSGRKIPWSGIFSTKSRHFYYSGICTGLAVLCLFYALKLITVTIANVMAGLEPLFTVGLSYLILRRQEEINAALVSGVLLVTVGVATIFVF